MSLPWTVDMESLTGKLSTMQTSNDSKQENVKSDEQYKLELKEFMDARKESKFDSKNLQEMVSRCLDIGYYTLSSQTRFPEHLKDDLMYKNGKMNTKILEIFTKYGFSDEVNLSSVSFKIPTAGLAQHFPKQLDEAKGNIIFSSNWPGKSYFNVSISMEDAQMLIDELFSPTYVYYSYLIQNMEVITKRIHPPSPSSDLLKKYQYLALC